MQMILPHNDYIGTASETKPTASSIPIGSTYYEYDTKEKYIVTPAASWERVDIAPYSYLDSIGHGLRSNHETWNKLGFHGNVVATSDVVWGVEAVYQFPSAAMGMEVISSATGDRASGVGVQSVHIHYLNSSFEEKEETVTLDGASAVATASTDIYRINYFEAYTVGADGVASGNIDIRHLSDTPIYSRIQAGKTAARDGVYTVPQGKELYIVDIDYGVVHTAANKYALMTLYANYNLIDSATSSIFYPQSTLMLDIGAIDQHNSITEGYPEGTDLKMHASSNGTAVISVQGRGYLESS